MVARVSSLISAFCLIGLTSTAFAEHGGITGGGGGTLPGDQVDSRYIMEAIAESRSVIDAFLKGAESGFVLDDGTAPRSWYHDYKKIFRPGNDVFRFLNEVPFRIISNGSCHGVDGSETDASANTDIEGGICMSVPRIQSKVTFANYRAEIGALILHELAHLYGSDEQEALSIQRIAVRFFSNKSPHDITTWNHRVVESLRAVSSMTEMLNDSLKAGLKISCDHVGNLESSYMSAVHELADGGSAMFLTREQDTEYYWQISTRIQAMNDFLCTQPGYTYEPTRHIYVDQFNKIWGADVELTADQYSKRSSSFPSNFNRFPLVTVKIKKYVSPDELPNDLDLVLKDIKALTQLLRNEWRMEFKL